MKIFIGTVAGVGVVKSPQVYLRPGEVRTTEIEGIGQLVNRRVADDFRLRLGEHAGMAEHAQLG